MSTALWVIGAILAAGVVGGVGAWIFWTRVIEPAERARMESVLQRTDELFEARYGKSKGK